MPVSRAWQCVCVCVFSPKEDADDAHEPCISSTLVNHSGLYSSSTVSADGHTLLVAKATGHKHHPLTCSTTHSITLSQPYSNGFRRNLYDMYSVCIILSQPYSNGFCRKPHRHFIVWTPMNLNNSKFLQKHLGFMYRIFHINSQKSVHENTRLDSAN